MNNILGYKEKYIYIISFLIIVLYNSLLLINTSLAYGIIFIPFLIVFILKPKLWIYFLAVYLPFETVILNFIPGDLVTIVRYGTEFFSYIVLIPLIFKYIRLGKRISLNKGDKFLLFFIAACILTALINQVSIEIFTLGLRWLIRYVVVYCIIKLLDWNLIQIRRLIHFILGIGFIVEVIGILQYFFRGTLDQILAPKVLDLDFITIEVTQADSKFAIFSTMGRYGEYGYLLTVITIMLLAKLFVGDKRTYTKIFMLLSVVSVLLCYARQVVLGLVIAFILAALFMKELKINKNKLIFSLLSGLIVVLLFIGFGNMSLGQGSINEGLSSRYFSMFSGQYLKDDFEGQGRLYFWTEVNGTFLSTKPLLGYGVGMYGTRPAIQYDTSVYENLGIPIKFSMDVYWTSILGQVGLIGVISLLGIYISFYKLSINLYKKSKNNISRMYCLINIMLIIAVLFQSFFGSNLSDRYQAFYIWLFFGLYDHIYREVSK
ncbi:O-antigen ligase family protein [Bacillus mobilis]|uniref:O-antigen ligase family protein n=2 Tax=Bacillus mobilis TaxID=2026190 RepID=UPI0039EE269D